MPTVSDIMLLFNFLSAVLECIMVSISSIFTVLDCNAVFFSVSTVLTCLYCCTVWEADYFLSVQDHCVSYIKLYSCSLFLVSIINVSGS